MVPLQSDLKPSASAKKQKRRIDRYTNIATTIEGAAAKEACKTAALTKSGTRKVLLEKDLRGPHQNSGSNANKGEFENLVCHNVGGSALLAAHLHERGGWSRKTRV
jgi:hypothetical protein